MDPVQKEQRHLLQIYHRYPLMIESGRGCWLFDPEGNAYLDAMSGIGVNALGYAHPRITDVLKKQTGLAVHTSNYVYHRYQGELAERLCTLSGMDRAFFCNSGTEAMEAALKAVRARGCLLHSNKTHLVALRRSFHGRTFGSLAVMGQPVYRERFEPFASRVSFVEPNDCAALSNVVCDETAGIVIEPVLGEGGIVPLNPGFLKLARKLASEADALLVLDEIQSGLGRTGRYFAYEWAGIHPDIVTLAKPLAAGLPLGATLFTEQAAEALPEGSHGTTFGGGPLACRVALEFLDVLDGLVPRISSLGAQIFRDLQRLREKYPSIVEIRGKGLMIGIELSFSGRPIVERALEHGLLINCTQDTVLRLLPPYILTQDEASQIIQRLDATLTATWQK
jgi:predicted acetylornithine/succinylornithine family transaminase